ncbi:dTDP-4-dehydrorhamnose 3,5-epimerase [Sphingomonas aracearum]|uniref:dTDP-4-dehydrorhamnose 3,5-epimerase n=1 Tax=Sphingomonas aracearum TaxID=2283317 RepID=A0A369W2J6_9SPHN|nr:dTDP-4-dehydrorhamnose 3,5-epimerase [Sphingomonas aracearum]RDE06291.1 dTDP-4-dehydrorhamnose 3,5-epimerase [Sphingomonas aracearum]
MEFEQTRLTDAFVIRPVERRDERGFFARTMCLDEMAGAGIDVRFVQQNMSVSNRLGTIRGMHFQQAPFQEAKLIRCLRGAIVDIIVDLRPDSPSYMQWQAFVLDDDNRQGLFVPPGFAHGFQTLTDDVEVTYLVSAPYSPAHEAGLRFDDPALEIDWPLPPSAVSDKDRAWPLLSERLDPPLAAVAILDAH